MTHAFKATILLILFVTVPAVTFGVDYSIGVLAGYDDNVNQTTEPAGSAFSDVFLNISHQTLHKEMFGESLLFFNADYKDFFEYEDELTASGGANYSFFPWKQPVMVQVLVEGGIFRDNEYPEDDYNWGKAALMLEYTVNRQVKFNFTQSVKGSFFLEPVELIVNMPGGSTPGGGGSGTTEMTVMKDQNDMLLSSDLGADLKLRSWLGLDMTLSCSRLLSSIENDEYHDAGGAAALNFSPEKSWLFTIRTSFFEKRFITLDTRKDRFTSSGLIISKMTDNFEVFADISVNDNHSTVSEESYKQTVSQCGISLFF